MGMVKPTKGARDSGVSISRNEIYTREELRDRLKIKDPRRWLQRNGIPETPIGDCRLILGEAIHLACWESIAIDHGFKLQEGQLIRIQLERMLPKIE